MKPAIRRQEVMILQLRSELFPRNTEDLRGLRLVPPRFLERPQAEALLGIEEAPRGPEAAAIGRRDGRSHPGMHHQHARQALPA
jgi:hypothetical protein